jgi:predicted phosphodiesterase
MKYQFRLFRFLALFSLAVLSATQAPAQDSVDKTMDQVITRFYATMSLDELYALDDAKVRSLLTSSELNTLSTKHWYFDVNAPVVVSVLRNVDQAIPPFWLEASGFKKTDMIVSNAEQWTYEVWQKNFSAGQVGLGINGFDNFRPHYLVCVGPQQPGTKLELSNFFPADQTFEEMKDGAMCYHDWTELVLEKVPASLQGHTLLHTKRGRSREATLAGGFRKTLFPSSDKPAPVFLTWSGDPATTQNIQWRTNTSVTDGVVRFRNTQSKDDFIEASASFTRMEDRMLANDRYCHWHTAVLQGLSPATTYEYRVGSPSKNLWSDATQFTTAPAGGKPFSFMYCSDTHNRDTWRDLQKKTFEDHPEAAFSVISGDLTVTGMERDCWDAFFTYGEPMYRTRPVMPTIGNHDAQYGLGAGMYLDIFGLPQNGPKEIKPEAAYTFTYSNAQFFMLDVMSDSAPQGEWLRKELERSKATWKIAVFHFPFYTTEAEYPELHKDWGTWFDKYHVDVVLTGHVHTHLRTYPMYAGKRVATPAEGTVYVQSVSIPSRELRRPKAEFVEQWLGGGSFCNIIDIDGKIFTFRGYGPDGSMKDTFTIEK